jgi:hypothetical protein
MLGPARAEPDAERCSALQGQPAGWGIGGGRNSRVKSCGYPNLAATGASGVPLKLSRHKERATCFVTQNRVSIYTLHTLVTFQVL